VTTAPIPCEFVRPAATGPAFRVWIPGDPVPKGRPVFFRVGKGVRATTPAKTFTYENWVRQCALAEAVKTHDVRPWLATEAPLSISLWIYLAPPKDKKRRAGWPDRRGNGDLDNYVKSVLDGLALAGLFRDDVQVVSLQAIKVWSDEPGALVELRAVGA